MKKLIIAEKPSLMRTINAALATKGEHFSPKEDKEYYESEHFVSTSQFGHLLELKMPEEYPGREHLGTWSVENLPFFPAKYEYKVKEDAKKRFDTIGRLLKRADIDTIIHCGDADREGQQLIDVVLREHKNTKPVIRPQFKALTDEAILDALKKSRPNSEFRNLFNEGMTRMCFDWDFGINLSQYATVRTGARPALNIGRVIGAIVNEIYIRDKAIENFVPEEYFKVVSDIEGGFKLTSKEKFKGDEQERAEEWARKLQAGDSIVSNIEEKKVTKRPPKLFSQTSLQAAMSKRFGYKPDQTLDLSQSLYEKGLTTYPRTNTEYMPEDEKELVRSVIDKVNAKGYLEFKDTKAVFDDTKIDGHSAIIVTGKHPSSSNLTDEEMNCYKTILYRFMAVFTKEPCIYNKTTVTIDNPSEQFKVSGEVLVQEGWQKFEPKKGQEKKEGGKDDDDSDDNRTLPKVSAGDRVETDFQAVSAETKPPKHYTVETLGKWMENPFRKEDAGDEEDYKNILAGLEIGTEATRAKIIEKAVSKSYISLRKNSYRIEPRGEFLVEASAALGIDFSAKMTADMGRKLKAVGRGNIGVMDVLSANRKDVSRIISENRPVMKDSADYGGTGDYVPKEKTEAQVFAPTGETVSFNKEWGGHTFTDEEVALLLAGEEISFEAVSSKGNTYTATGRLCKQKYQEKKGRKILRSGEFWGFALNEREFPESWGGHTFTEEEKAILLQNCKKDDRMIYAEDLWSEKKSKYYSAHLVWNKKKRCIEPVFKRK